jgi:hydroxyacyl-ACP dehydratase HTD2-like protein with hotdog domain
MKVEVGMEIPELVKDPTTQQLARYAGASGDFYQIHFDKDFALAVGLPGVILHGLLKTAFLGQLVTDWVGEEGIMTDLQVTYRGLDFPGRPYRCRGVVRSVEGATIGLDVWGEDSAGNRTTIGTATVQAKQ